MDPNLFLLQKLQRDFQARFQYELFNNPNFAKQQFRHFFYLPFHHNTQPNQVIIISDSEDENQQLKQDQKQQIVQQPIVKPTKKVSMLNLDKLEEQGKLYDCESSQSSPIQRKIASKQYKTIKKQQKKKQYKIRKENYLPLYHTIKPVLIGTSRQQLKYQQSTSVKNRLIKVYEKNSEKFSQVFEILKQNCPDANDEDVAILLNIVGKNYDKAISLIQENGLSIQNYIDIYKNYSDDENFTNKK